MGVVDIVVTRQYNIRAQPDISAALRSLRHIRSLHLIYKDLQPWEMVDLHSLAVFDRLQHLVIGREGRAEKLPAVSSVLDRLSLTQLRSFQLQEREGMTGGDLHLAAQLRRVCSAPHLLHLVLPSSAGNKLFFGNIESTERLLAMEDTENKALLPHLQSVEVTECGFLDLYEDDNYPYAELSSHWINCLRLFISH